MKRFVDILLAVLAAGIAFQSAAGQARPPLTPDLEWKGRIVVEFAAGLGEIQLNHDGNIALLGKDNLDALARQFGVYEIQPAIPGAQKPANAEIRDLSRFYIVEFPLDVDLHEVARAYTENSNVATAEPYYVRRCDYTPNDPMFPQQWALDITDAETAYDYCQGSDSVIVGLVDTGIDTAHVDLRDNLWVNPGEDLNGNGMIEPSEWNRIDDDQNGYIDDFWGWNVWQNNNNVQDPPGAGHGTACAGCASAVTDNGLGISSLGWKAKIMTAKAGDWQYIYASAAGINYLANNGANVISLSYGGSYYSALEAAAVSNAWQQGAIIVASAGNDAAPYLHYPAAYNDVVAVTATDPNDQLCSFANYGTWIDVCAPGELILTTIPGSNYTICDGTSFSAPIVGGLACLVWAARPDFTNSEVLEQIYSTCVNIDSLNPGYGGLLGHGRIDAGAAISGLYPQLNYTEQAIDDSAGNANGRPDPGEIVNLLLTLQNSSPDVNAVGVVVNLTCSDPDIDILQNTSNFGDIPAGSSANNHSSPITFAVDSSAMPHEVILILTLTEAGTGLTLMDEIVQMIGRPEIVVIDDDGGANYQLWYDLDLDSLNLAHDIWHVSSQGEIPQAEIQLYPTAVWHTSNSDSPLSGTEQEIIAAYLANGGKLFLTGEDIDEQLAGTTFYANVLRCRSLSQPGSPQLSGVPGDPISNGTNLILAGAGGAQNNLSPSSIAPVPGAFQVYTYNNTGLGAAIRWTNSNGAIVYFAFCFEAASGIASTSRQVVLSNVLDWFASIATSPLQILLAPYGAPIVIPASGGAFNYNIMATNDSTGAAIFQAWCDVTLPNGSPYGPVLGPVNITLPAGGSIARDRTQNVPGNAPAGQYSYNAYLGTYPSVILSQDSFNFTKLGTGDLSARTPSEGLGAGEWTNTGESFKEEVAVEAMPDGYALSRPHPNPFNPTTILRFELRTAILVRLSVYDLSGRRVAELINGWREAGSHQVTFDGLGMASGVYVVRLDAGGQQASQKMVLMK